MHCNFHETDACCRTKKKWTDEIVEFPRRNKTRVRKANSHRFSKAPKKKKGSHTQNKMGDEEVTFRYASSMSFEFQDSLATNERKVTKWSAPIPKDASAVGPESRKLIAQRNKEHWDNLGSISNNALSKAEFKNYIDEPPCPEDEELFATKGLSTFAQAFRILQEQYQARPGKGLMPIYLKKDWNLDKHEYTPADYAMLTVDTTHEQPSNDNGLHELQHIPMIVQLVASVLYGERTNERSGVCPQFVQIPRAEMPIQEAEKTSEKIYTEVLFSNKDKIAMTLQVMQQWLDDEVCIEYIDIRIRTFFDDTTLPKETSEAWNSLKAHLPMIKKQVAAPETPAFLLETKSQQLKKRQVLYPD